MSRDKAMFIRILIFDKEMLDRNVFGVSEIFSVKGQDILRYLTRDGRGALNQILIVEN